MVRRTEASTRVSLSRASATAVAELVELARASVRLHRPWVYLPSDAKVWHSYVRRVRHGNAIGYVVRRRDTGQLVGVVNLSEIVRGVFQSAYLSFYAHAAHAGKGFMSEGLEAVVRRAFREHGLHRVEANIQPRNRASRRLVRRLGFTREGFSPRYLKIGGRWRDHERWALTREAWQAASRSRRGRRTTRCG
jgi:ribosomal-protein-alanine N-acetyltransferase